VYAVENRVDAAQIFELNNDRGKPLTDLESIKSFLMYLTLLHAKNRDDLLKRIEGVFTQIFRIAEDCEELGAEQDENAILRYHCIAFEKWGESEYSNPKQLVKDSVHTMQAEKVGGWIEEFCTRLRESFDISKALIGLAKSDEVIGDLFALGRVGPFFPLLLKVFRYRDRGLDQFRRVTRLLEMFSFRAYGIANVRANTASSRLYREARDFCGDFDSLVSLLREMCSSWWSVEERFLAALEGPDFYSQGSDARYFLWKYENHLRGHSFPPIPLVDFLSQDNRTGFSIEHIAAQKDDDVSSSKIEIDGRDEEFSRTYLHSIGNLVLDTRSDNSRKGCDPFLNKLASYREAPLRSQLELEKFAEHRGDGAFMWNKTSIQNRKSVLAEFAKAHWNPASV
ncbi:MAG: HNH endonuclease family protein, partial [Candidatus Sulfotelmatobacter sp.]